MERSRSKRTYYYDSQTAPRNKRYNQPHGNNYNRRRGGGGGGGGEGRAMKSSDSPISISFRILCSDAKVGGIIGKSGLIIKAIRQETGAWINVHQLIPGDEERIIEVSDSRPRNADGRFPVHCPAQEALLSIHDRMIEFDDSGFGFERDADANGGMSYVVTRLVVPQLHVGCLMGKGGRIIEQMRVETNTQIRILPRDQHIPRCVSMSEEIVQIVGDSNSVRRAVFIISTRLKESFLRDRGPFPGRSAPTDNYYPNEDEFSSPNIPRASHPTGYAMEPMPASDHHQPFPVEELIFRILCSNNKVESVMSESRGIVEMLRSDVGVEVTVTDPVPGSDERILIVSSDEGPDNELFPAQEALLHIQSKIVDLVPDKDNIITTRLLISTNEISFLDGEDGSLSEIRQLTHANVEILPKEELPLCAFEVDELVQIVGEIRAAREALIQVTSKLRNQLFRGISLPKDLIPSSISTSGHLGNASEIEDNSPINSSSHEGPQGMDPSTTSNVQISNSAWQSKDAMGCISSAIQKENGEISSEILGVPKRSHTPIVTKTTLEVVIPEHAIPSLTMRSGSKLAQISEMSGATVAFVEDRSDSLEKVIKISGSPEQAERAQRLLEGFILSTQDVPES